jgi:hypothetical protein
MFILYAVLVGLPLGLLLGGRPAGLADLQFRWAWAMLLGLAIQVILFSSPVSDVVGAAGPPIYIASTGLVLFAILLNRRITGMPVVALGAISNLAAIVANGGYMPTDPALLAEHGSTIPTTYSNSAIVPQPALRPLTDIYVLPDWLPFANVFSVGDALIALGVCLVIVAAMRRRVPASTGASVPST